MAAFAKTAYTLANKPDNAESAEVDGIELVKNGEPKSLTAAQAKRLEDAGVELSKTPDKTPDTNAGG